MAGPSGAEGGAGPGRGSRYAIPEQTAAIAARRGHLAGTARAVAGATRTPPAGRGEAEPPSSPAPLSLAQSSEFWAPNELQCAACPSAAQAGGGGGSGTAAREAARRRDPGGARGRTSAAPVPPHHGGSEEQHRPPAPHGRPRQPLSAASIRPPGLQLRVHLPGVPRGQEPPRMDALRVGQGRGLQGHQEG